MKKLITIILLTWAISGCQDEIVKTKEVLTDMTVSPETISGSGQSSAIITVLLSDDASADRRNVKFRSSAGTFDSTGKSEAVVKAEYVEGKLTATAKLAGPNFPTKITITAEPEFNSPVKEYSITREIDVTPSLANTISLNPSRMGLASNFRNEVLLKATILNQEGKWVSSGTPVIFRDELPDGTPAQGRFRDVVRLSNDSSYTSSVYSAGPLPVGTNVSIIAAVVDTNGNETMISDTILLTINE
jgi:hypothetical protein